MKGDAELPGKGSGESEIAIGLVTPQAMMQMSGVQNQSQFPALSGERAKKRDGVGATGKTYGKPHARFEQ